MLFGKHVRNSRLPGESPGSAIFFVSRPRLRALLRVLEGGLWVVALLAVGYLGYVALDRVIYEKQQARRLRELSSASTLAFASRPLAVGPPPAATRQPPQDGELIGRLDIPDADISVIVAAGTDALTLRRGVGHIQGTALPGEPGNVGLAGHRDTVFRGLRNLRVADRIFLVTADESFEYVVESLQTVTPERGDVLNPSAHPTLTLVTCYPFDFVGPAPLRFIVRAREVGRSTSGLGPLGSDGAGGVGMAQNP